MDRTSPPRVSVIIAAWQAEAFLGRAIESALGQSMPDLEVIVVDDASSDGSFALAQSYAARDTRVRAFRRDTNGGPSGARNLALDHALGEWVGVLDADDAFEPTRLERLLGLAGRLGVDLAADNLLLVPEDDWQGAGKPLLSGRAAGEARVIPLDAFILGNRLSAGEKSLGFLQPLMRRALIEGAGLRYDGGIRIGEDYLFVLELMARGAKLGFDPEPLYRYVIRGASISRKLTLPHVHVMLAVDAGFTAQHAAGLDATARAALQTRREGLLDMAAYLEGRTRLIQRDVMGAARAVAARPKSLGYLSGTLRHHLGLLFPRARQAGRSEA